MAPYKIYFKKKKSRIVRIQLFEPRSHLMTTVWETFEVIFGHQTDNSFRKLDFFELVLSKVSHLNLVSVQLPDIEKDKVVRQRQYRLVRKSSVDIGDPVVRSFRRQIPSTDHSVAAFVRNVNDLSDVKQDLINKTKVQIQKQRFK